MNILFDHQLFYNRYGGASKYLVMLMNSMPKDSWKTTALFPINEYAGSKGLMKTYKQHFRGQIRLTEAINNIYTNLYLRHGNYDVLHLTNFNTSCFKALGTKPMVTTFHDINLSTHLPQPEMVEKQRKTLRRANAIICISENTKRDMLNIFEIDDRKVHVIYHGVEMPNLSLLPKEKFFDFPYILYVGVRLEYKNFHRLIKAFAIIREHYPELKLVCTSFPFTDKEQEEFNKLGISEQIIHISASEEQMIRLYRDALYFIYPSIYEGFGMPILEAWSCHCPVLLSNTSCFPEIAQEAGLYFNPEDIDNIAYTMQKALDDLELRENLRRLGDKRVKLFSWKKCADEHMRVYKTLV